MSTGRRSGWSRSRAAGSPRSGLPTCRLADPPTWSKSSSRPVAKSPSAATLCAAAFLLPAEPPALAIAVLRRLTSARRLCYASIRRTAHGPTSLPRSPAGSHGSKARSGKQSGKTKEHDLHSQVNSSAEIWTISIGRLVARLRRKARLSSDFRLGRPEPQLRSKERLSFCPEGLLEKH